MLIGDKSHKPFTFSTLNKFNVVPLYNANPVNVPYTKSVDAHLGSFVDSAITINRWVDDSVDEIHHPLLRFFVPGLCIRFEGPVKLRVRAQCAEERCLVIRRAAQPAICQATPGSNGITRSKLLFAALWGFEIFVCAAAGTGVRLRSQDIL